MLEWICNPRRPHHSPLNPTITINKETIKFIIQLITSILTVIATTLGVTFCLG